MSRLSISSLNALCERTFNSNWLIKLLSIAWRYDVLSTFVQSITFPSCFCKSILSQIRVVQPLVVLNGWAKFISMYFESISWICDTQISETSFGQVGLPQATCVRIKLLEKKQMKLPQTFEISNFELTDRYCGEEQLGVLQTFFITILHSIQFNCFQC